MGLCRLDESRHCPCPTIFGFFTLKSNIARNWRVQCDEIWSFCYAKQKNVPADKQGQFGYGELQLTNPNLTEDMAEIVDNAELDDDQQQKLEREFAREYQLITREERLARIAEDIVAHFMGRGVLAKSTIAATANTRFMRFPLA